MSTDEEKALEKRDGFLDASGAMASPGDDEGIIAVLPVSDIRNRRDRPGYRSHYSVKLKHRKGIPLECSPLPAAGGSDGPVKEEAGGEMLVEPLKGTDDTLAHSERSKSPVGDVGGDSVETFLDVPAGPANLGFLRALRREMGVFNFEGEGAEDLSAVSSRNAPNEGRREPTEHPLVGMAHAKFGPSAIDEGGDRYGALLDRIGTAFALGGEGNPDLCDGTGPGAIVFDSGEKLGKAVPDRYREELEVLNGPTIKSPCLALGHAKDSGFEIKPSEIRDGVVLRVGAEEVSILFLEFAKDSRALRAMENIFVPSEGSEIGKFLRATNEGSAVGAEQETSADGRFVFGPPVALSLAASLRGVPCFAEIDSPGGGMCPLGLRKVKTGNPI